jgi:hypothetical protein
MKQLKSYILKRRTRYALKKEKDIFDKEDIVAWASSDTRYKDEIQIGTKIEHHRKL